jgi:hypothetical protein
MDWAMFGWREGILLLVGLAVLYLVVTVVRLIRVARRTPAAQEQEAPYLVEPAVISEDKVPVEPAVQPEAASPRNTDWDDVADLDLLGTAREGASQAKSPAAATGFGEQFAEHLARSEMEMEIRHLRKEMEAMRAELEELRAARYVSPHYAEAMELSQRGLTAQDVADRLGISLGEAELVHALSRGDRNFDEGEEDGDGTDRDARDAGSDRFEPSVGVEPRRTG